MDMTKIEALKADIEGLAFSDDPPVVQQKSRDFFWYSPVLRHQLDRVTADIVVTPASEDDVRRVLAACYRHDVPLTVRGAGTGNYGQSVPLSGGVVLDISGMRAVTAIRDGAVTVEPGARAATINAATRADSNQELRVYPSTSRTATIGGFIAGGIGGIGAVRFGPLSEPGTVLGLRLLTMEAEPRVVVLTGDDVHKAMHSYGTTGVITELELGLAPAHDWVEVFVCFEKFMTAARFGNAVAASDEIVANEVGVIAAPFPHDGFLQHRAYFRANQHACILLVAAESLPALEALTAQFQGVTVFRSDRLSAADRTSLPPAEELVWNHTTLRAIRIDPTVTYLQVLYPPKNHLEHIENLLGKLTDEVITHLEFVRVGGELTCYAIPIVRYTTDDRLNEINAAYEDSGCLIFNPHRYTVEEGGMKRSDSDQLAFKRDADPKGLLNPGKMIAWEDPHFKVSARSMYLFPGLDTH